MNKRLFIVGCFFLTSCFSNNNYQVSRISSYENQIKPILSGNGKQLAFIIDDNGDKKIRLIHIASGRRLPLRHISRHEPYSAPSLSWNGRYLAIISKFQGQRIALIEDLLAGIVYKLPLDFQDLPENISLTPDASKVVIQFGSDAASSLRFLDLTNKLTKDFSHELKDSKSLSNN